MYSLQYIPFHKLYYFNLKVRQCLESGTRNFSFYCPTKIQAQIAKYTVLCVNRDTSTVIGGGPGQNFRVQFSCANLSQCSIPSSKLSCQPILVLFYFPLSGFPSFVLQHLTWQSSWQGEFNCDTPRSHTHHRRANPTEWAYFFPAFVHPHRRSTKALQQASHIQANSHQLYLCIRNITKNWKDGIPLLWRKDERVGFLQPGGEKALGRPQSSLQGWKGGLQKRLRQP